MPLDFGIEVKYDDLMQDFMDRFQEKRTNYDIWGTWILLSALYALPLRLGSAETGPFMSGLGSSRTFISKVELGWVPGGLLRIWLEPYRVFALGVKLQRR